MYILWKEAPLIFSRNLDWSRDWKLLTSKKSIITKWGGKLFGTVFLFFVLSKEYSWKTWTKKARTTDTQWRHESKISEKLGQCDRQKYASTVLPGFCKIECIGSQGSMPIMWLLLWLSCQPAKNLTLVYHKLKWPKLMLKTANCQLRLNVLVDPCKLGSCLYNRIGQKESKQVISKLRPV